MWKGRILLIQLGYGGHPYADQADMSTNTVDPIKVIKSIPIQILASLCFPASQVCKSSQCEENGSPAQQHLCCISSLHGLTGQQESPSCLLFWSIQQIPIHHHHRAEVDHSIARLDPIVRRSRLSCSRVSVPHRDIGKDRCQVTMLSAPTNGTTDTLSDCRPLLFHS